QGAEVHQQRQGQCLREEGVPQRLRGRGTLTRCKPRDRGPWASGDSMPSDTFTLGDLTAVIGDNDAKGEHKAGYNGLWSLTHKTDPTNLFVPTVAGMNFEHIFDGETLDFPGKSEVFFEPRHAEMTFKKVSATVSELHQPPTPTFKLESTTR